MTSTNRSLSSFLVDITCNNNKNNNSNKNINVNKNNNNDDY